MIKKIFTSMLLIGVLVSFSKEFLPKGFAQQRSLYEFLGSDDRNTVIIQDFDENEAGSKRVTWTTDASRYITKTDDKPYPQVGFINAFSNTLSKEFVKEDKESMRVLALRAAFNQKGYNFVELVPYENTRTPRETDKNGNQAPGIYFDSPILKIGAYVWGSRRNYTLEAQFVTPSGQDFSVYMGSLDYDGWKILSGNIPLRYYKAGDLVAAENTYAVKLKKLVVWTNPTARVDDFIVYFDNLFVSTTVERLYFDGSELADEEVIDSIEWTSDGSDDSSGTSNQ